LPQQSVPKVLQEPPVVWQQEVGPPPSACRPAQDMEQQSSPEAQRVLVVWQVG